MPSADTNPIPNSGPAPQQPASAKQECGEEAPPMTLAAIGRALQVAQVRRDAADNAALAADSGSKEHRRQYATMDVLQDRHDALSALAMTMRPANLEDAAVLIGATIGVAYDLAVNELTEDEADEQARAIMRAVLEVFPVVVESAGLDMESFAWASFDNLASSTLADVTL